MSATYYVRKQGDDSNGGTDPDTDAVLTLSAAEALAGQTDTIDIGEGTWEEDVTQGYQFDGAGKYKTFITGIIVSSGNNKRLLLKDMTFNLNADVTTRLSAYNYNGYGFEFDNCRFLGHGYGMVSGSIYLYGALKAVDSVLDAVNTSTTTIFHQLNQIDSNAPALYLKNSIITARPGQYQLIRVGSGENNLIQNCTFYASPTVKKIYLYGHSTTHINNYFYNVVYYSVSFDATEQTYIPPVFRDLEGGDFRFRAGAPQIGGGV